MNINLLKGRLRIKQTNEDDLRKKYGKTKEFYNWDLLIDYFLMSNYDFYRKYRFSWSPSEILSKEMNCLMGDIGDKMNYKDLLELEEGDSIIIEPLYDNHKDLVSKEVQIIETWRYTNGQKAYLTEENWTFPDDLEICNIYKVI